MRRSPYFPSLALGLALLAPLTGAQAQVAAPKATEMPKAQSALPTTETFMNTLGTCAAGMNVQISAKMTGSVKEFYEGQKTEGSAFLENAPDLLKLFPDADKIVAYRLYLDCILKIVGAPKEQANVPKRETCVSVYLECVADLRKNDKSSAQSCKRYVECDPENAKAHISLAQAQIETKNPTGAKESLEKARTLEPDNSFVIAASYREQALSAFEDRRFDDAQRYALLNIEYSMKANNRVSVGRGYATLGIVEVRLQNFRAADRAFGKSIELLEPTNDKRALARTYRLYGRALARHGQPRRGCAYMLKARALSSGADDVRGKKDAERALDNLC